MSDYLDKVSGKKFMDLLEEKEFKKDLVRFFSGPIYSMTPEEMKERGFEGLANDFVRHMRYQSTNEFSAIRDLSSARSESSPEEFKQAFGSLMEAFDASDGGGTGVVEGVWDYASALATSPSTAVTVGSLGFGAGSKLAGRGVTAAAQLAVRNELLKQVSKKSVRKAATAQAGRELAEQKVRQKIAAGTLGGMPEGVVAKRQAQRVLTGSVGKEAAKSVGMSAAFEGAIGALGTAAALETREATIEDFEYTKGDVLTGALISATLGGGLGGAAGAFSAYKRNQAFETFFEAIKREEKAARKARKNATSTLTQSKASKKYQELGLTRAGAVLDALDPNAVIKGDTLRRYVLTAGDYNPALSDRGLSLDTLRGIAAATIDIADQVKIKPKERITSAVSRGIDSGLITTKKLDEIKKKYNLSNDAMSAIFISELSEAGKVLQTASNIKQVLRDVKGLANRGVSMPNEQVLEDITAAVKDGSATGLLDKGLWFFREADRASIAFMTSQLGTTAANVAGTGLTIAADTSDQLAKAFYRTILKGDLRGAGNSLRSSIGVLRGFTTSKDEAELLQTFLAKDMPLEYKRTFYDVIRADEVTAGESSMLVRIARKANFFNSITDAAFKKSIFYAMLDRRMRDAALQGGTKYGNVTDFLKRGTSLEEIGEDLVNKAVDDTRRLTMQRTYYGDKTPFGQTAAAVEKIHRKVPFLMSQGIGVPFPRYVANHLEYIGDYTGLALAGDTMGKTLNAMGLGGAGRKLIDDPLKEYEDRVARFITGMSGVFLGAQLHKAGYLPTYDQFLTGEAEGGVDLKRSFGPFIASTYLGVAMARIAEGETLDKPFLDTVKEIGDITVGMTELGFQGGAIGDLLSYADNPSPTTADAFAKSAGNFLSTFTYPAAVARDLYGQIDPKAAPTPYTRPILRGSMYEQLPERNFFGDILKNETLLNQAVRFAPDLQSFKLASNQSMSDGYDLPQYSIFNPYPVNSFNPIRRQMGFKQEAPTTTLQREARDLDLKEYRVKKRIANPAVDWWVTASLAKGNRLTGSRSLNDEFKIWAKTGKIDKFSGRTYEQLTEPREKREALKDFIRDYSTVVQTAVEDTFESMLKSPEPQIRRQAFGYVRNFFFIETSKVGNKSKVAEATRRVSRGKFSDPAEFVLETGDIDTEITRKYAILEELGNIED